MMPPLLAGAPTVPQVGQLMVPADVIVPPLRGPVVATEVTVPVPPEEMRTAVQPVARPLASSVTCPTCVESPHDPTFELTVASVVATPPLVVMSPVRFVTAEP